MLAVGALYTALPDSLAIGPRWLHPTMLVVMLGATIITHRRGDDRLNQVLGYTLAGLITLFLVWSLARLVWVMPTHDETPAAMLRSAIALWMTNALVFAYWYWRIDRGGPHARTTPESAGPPAFLFPQMTLPELQADAEAKPWTPGFVDYLFIAFNTSMAFSPTDVPVLTKSAKGLTMLQALISLVIVVVLVARAINIF